MSKVKIVIKETDMSDGFSFCTKYRGEDGVCMAMAMGFAVDIAKRHDFSLEKLKSLVTDLYNSRVEENENEN